MQVKIVNMNLQEQINKIKKNMRLNESYSYVDFFVESIDPSEAYTDEGALQTIIDGKRDIGSLHRPSDEMKKLINFHGLKLIKIEKNPQDVYIVYRPGSEDRVEELLSIANKYHGYFSYLATKEDTIRIGQLLGYTQDKIDQYVKERYN
jgi:hypothetical protein